MTPRDHWITAGLALFCAVMTFLLVRSEYFPESSLLQQVPPEYVIGKVFRHLNSSALKVEWKGEEVGSFNLRVTPGATTRVHSLLECQVPVLGQKTRMRIEVIGSLKSPHQMERLFMRGKWQERMFELNANADTGQVVVEAKGEDLVFRREYRVRDFLQTGATNALAALPELPQGVSVSQAQQWADGFTRWRLYAWCTRVHRFGDWMDAYLLSARLDENWWLKFWVSPTGELLTIDSGFGLRAINEDFFTPLQPDGQRAVEKP